MQNLRTKIIPPEKDKKKLKGSKNNSLVIITYQRRLNWTKVKISFSSLLTSKSFMCIITRKESKIANKKTHTHV